MNRLTLASGTAAAFMAAALFSNTVTLRLFLLLICAGLVLVAVVMDGASIRALPPLWLPFALWAGWAWLSLAWSIEPERSLKELRNEIIYAGLAFWMCYVAAQARESARVMLPVLCGAVLLLCAVALYQFPLGLVRNGERWHGGSGNLSTLVLTLLPCALMAAWYGHRNQRRQLGHWGLGVSIALMVAAYTTLNRTIWLGIAIQVVLMAGLLGFRDGRVMGLRAKLIGASAAVLVLSGAGVISAHIHYEREEAAGKMVVAEDPRLKLWPEVLEHVKARPLTGYGFGRGMLRRPLQSEFNDPLLWHAHNLFLEATMQLGLPGLILLLVLIGATLRQGWRLARSPETIARACGIAALAVVVGMVIRNMTDVLWVRHNALIYWAILGVLFAWGQRASAAGRPS